MVRCVVVCCPLCEKRTYIPGERASTDVFADRIGAHVHTHHPETPPDESEAAIEAALESVEVAEADVDPEDVEGWTADDPTET